MASSNTPETIMVDGKKYRHVREGLASVLAPYSGEPPTSTKSSKNNDEGDQAVFYNPIQQFNRDLSVLAISVYGEAALLEKLGRVAHKNRNAKRKKAGKGSHAPPAAQLDNSANNEAEQPNARKRKADHLEDAVVHESTEEPAKKLKPNGHDEDNVKPLVAELTADADAPVNDTVGEGLQPEPVASTGAADPEVKPPANPKKQLPFAILDALSATGLRALRYAKEISFATNIVANDLSSASVETIKLNIKHNDVGDKVQPNLGDARAFMYTKVGNEHPRPAEGYVHRFDVIDIDPYGTAAPFFDCSLQAIQDGGMLCITCTDAGVFASTGYPEKTFALYGGIPVKGPHSHEGGLRLILNGIAISAAKYGLAIEPLLSLYIDYYARLFIRVHRKQQEVKLLAGTSMMVYNCGHGCGAWVTQPLLRNKPQTSKSGDTFYKFSFAQAPSTNRNCEHCGSRMHLCGPMWSGPLHNPQFVEKMLKKARTLDKDTYVTVDRIEGMLTLALEEDLAPTNSDADGTEVTVAEDGATHDSKPIPRLATDKPDVAPFFIMPTYLAKIIHCATPSEDAMRGALLGLGYKVSRSHCKPGSIKTNAPWSVLWEVIREFMRTKAPIKDGAVRKGTAGYQILSRVRGTERALVSELRDVTREQLGRCETKDDLKTVLQGILYRLENEKSPLPPETGESSEPKDGGEEAAAQPEEPPNGHRSRSTSPSVPPPNRLKITFDEKLGKEKPRGKLLRYQMNPRENWGPMSRAGRTS
ncbi:N2,N2-dimethylguanosine tRNA methyltransferase [Fonsecaea pedrosoi CBS 271.37]|uniref:tRNA (guanine(26)-N(2))-dimethyltransferase n=1 Tax=Fonsecaea pedrosoi CBS 271.37 TaxID=1442368 RepID=A0A0D2H909_9EURO|nr:N2,N2-dimethylguanosine tRNA methyltransferase [Fonsecaea pedrosoi CBS 271.37]KIW81029.1 N2,N2-dimethylguanosine tRNA methyltransferase [Fonsecaea pedrosoi CBS 271.37]